MILRIIPILFLVHLLPQRKVRAEEQLVVVLAPAVVAEVVAVAAEVELLLRLQLAVCLDISTAQLTVGPVHQPPKPNLVVFLATSLVLPLAGLVPLQLFMNPVVPLATSLVQLRADHVRRRLFLVSLALVLLLALHRLLQLSHLTKLQT